MLRIAQLTKVLLHFLKTFLVQFTQKGTLGTQREWPHYFLAFLMEASDLRLVSGILITIKFDRKRIF